jgi:hypothetical protein
MTKKLAQKAAIESQAQNMDFNKLRENFLGKDVSDMIFSSPKSTTKKKRKRLTVKQLKAKKESQTIQDHIEDTDGFKLVKAFPGELRIRPYPVAPVDASHVSVHLVATDNNMSRIAFFLTYKEADVLLEELCCIQSEAERSVFKLNSTARPPRKKRQPEKKRATKKKTAKKKVDSKSN